MANYILLLIMLKQIHQFNQSQIVETASMTLHDKVFLNYQEEMNRKQGTSFVTKIDRKSCDYNTTSGKAYQQADTDTILHLNCSETQSSMIKYVSEKTRTRYYNDLYLEIISVFKYNTNKEMYESQQIGWALKNGNLSPDCLSMLFIDKQSNKNISLFIDNYKKLKESLFTDNFKEKIAHKDFENWLNKVIKLDPQKGNKSFIINIEGKNKNHVKNVVFARNGHYITVGFTFDIEYIKSLNINILKTQF